VPPGTYDLLISPRPDDDRRHYLGEEAATVVVPGIEVPREGKGADADAPVRVRIPASQGRVTGRLVLCDPEAAKGLRYGRSLALRVVGQRACATTVLPMVGRRAPLVLGPPPEGLLIRQPGSFILTQLPPGSYRAFLTFCLSDPEIVAERFPVHLPLVRFELQEGQSLDLGEIPVEVPPDLLNRLRADEERNLEWRYGPIPESLSRVPPRTAR
jgi:hypothetical protein